MTSRRAFVEALAVLPSLSRVRARAEARVDARPTALFAQPDGRANLVRISVTGVAAPAARARVVDRRGALVGTAGLLPDQTGTVLAGEVLVPLAEPATFQVDVEVGRERVARARVRLAPPRRWTLYWLSTSGTALGGSDEPERALETHRRNLDAALARLAERPAYRWTAECALQVKDFLAHRGSAAGDALLQAIRDGKIGFHALFANVLAGMLDHDTYARLVWPAGLLSRERGLGYTTAQVSGMPGQPGTFPSLLAASGVRYLVSVTDSTRAVPLQPGADGITYPQLQWWEGPDGARVLQWRAHGGGDAARLGFAINPDAMARRVSDWLLTDPVLQSTAYGYDAVLLTGIDERANAPMRETMLANLDAFAQRWAFPRIVAGRAEDFFREVERRWGPTLPVRRGDSGTYREDGAAAAASEVALFREAQRAARAAELLALWDGLTETPDSGQADRIRRRSEARRRMWEDLLSFGEHTWGADTSGSDPDGAQAVAQWLYKRRFLETAWAAARAQVSGGLERIGRRTNPGRGRLVFNASSWDRTDLIRLPGGAGAALTFDGRDLPIVDLPDGDALAIARDVPALGYLALSERDRDPRPVEDRGTGLELAAGSLRLRLDAQTGAIASLVGADGVERVKASQWSGLNQLLYVTGGERSALWTDGDRVGLTAPPDLTVAAAESAGDARIERLPGIGIRIVAPRRVTGLGPVRSVVTLYDDLPWVDIENRFTKPERLAKEACYAAFPFAFTAPAVDIEVPLGRMRVERDQQPGACRDWYCHTNWVWITEGSSGVVWSGPDTPLITLNDLFRGVWRRSLTPDGTLFAWVLHNYWPANFPAQQGGAFTQRFRISLLPPGGDAAEPVRRGWAACDPLRVSAAYQNPATGRLLSRDRALVTGDPGAAVIAAKPADDGEGVVVKLLDVAGRARAVPVWPAAYRFAQARRCTLVEHNQDPLPLAGDGRTLVDVAAWGLSAARLFTPRESAG